MGLLGPDKIGRHKVDIQRDVEWGFGSGVEASLKREIANAVANAIERNNEQLARDLDERLRKLEDRSPLLHP